MSKVDYHDLRATPIQAKDALALAKKAKTVVGYTGKKETRYTLATDKPDDAALSKLIIGRSGTLRAPCLKAGDLFIGGYNEELYRELIKI